MNEVSLSIIVPVFNVEHYIEETVNSILSQTYTDFELLLVNDGSTDKSGEIVESLMKKEVRIKVFNVVNRGASAARNIGIDNARGKYIYFMDADDRIEGDTLEKCMGLFTHQNIDIVAFNATAFTSSSRNLPINEADSNKYYERINVKAGLYSGPGFYRTMTDENNFVASVCLYITKRSVISAGNLRFKEGIMHEDELFSRQLFLKSETVYYLKDAFYQRRIRDNSVSTKNVSSYKTLSLLTVAEALHNLSLINTEDRLKKDSEFLFHLSIDCLERLKVDKVAFDKTKNRLLSSALTAIYGFNKQHLFGDSLVSKKQDSLVQKLRFILRRFKYKISR